MAAVLFLVAAILMGIGSFVPAVGPVDLWKLGGALAVFAFGALPVLGLH